MHVKRHKNKDSFWSQPWLIRKYHHCIWMFTVHVVAMVLSPPTVANTRRGLSYTEQLLDRLAVLEVGGALPSSMHQMLLTACSERLAWSCSGCGVHWDPEVKEEQSKLVSDDQCMHTAWCRETGPLMSLDAWSLRCIRRQRTSFTAPGCIRKTGRDH